MYVVCVKLEVKPEKVGAFVELATYDARETRKEPGNLRFDLVRAVDNPLVFRLYEVYRDEDAIKAHQQTPHYARWKEEVPELLSSPRVSEKFTTVYPDPWA